MAGGTGVARAAAGRIHGIIFPRRNFASSCIDTSPKQMSVKCKVALITGGNAGIGLAIADSLLECGLHKAVITGRNQDSGKKAIQYLTKKHGLGRAEFKVLDVRNHKQFEDVYKDVQHREVNVDILVNNAGILREEEWEKQVDTNVNGVIKGCLLANEYMPSQKHKGGCVLNVASIAGFDKLPLSPHYAATKHAVIGLTKSFGASKEFSKTNVRHVAVCPGFTLTGLWSNPMSHQVFQSLKKVLKLQDAKSVGNGAVYTIEYGPPGSIWTIENAVLAKVTPPERKAYYEKVMEF